MRELIASLAGGTVLFEESIHGPCRTQILACIEQSGLNRGGRAILKARGIQHGAHGFAFFLAQGASRRGARSYGQRRTEYRLAIERSASHAENLAGGLDADRRSELRLPPSLTQTVKT